MKPDLNILSRTEIKEGEINDRMRALHRQQWERGIAAYGLEKMTEFAVADFCKAVKRQDRDLGNGAAQEIQWCRELIP